MSSLIFGINENAHNASLSVVTEDKILFSAESERFTKVKNDPYISRELVSYAIDTFGKPDKIAYYENPRLKHRRVVRHGGFVYGAHGAYREMHHALRSCPEVSFGHHESHAAAGFFTSKFDTATVIVVDAIGEFDTASIWHGSGRSLKKLLSIKYPVSFGLFYSWFTASCGLEAGKDEYILMGMSAYGDKSRFANQVEKVFPSICDQGINFHKLGKLTDIGIDAACENDIFDVASAVQYVFEKRILEFVALALQISKSKNLVLMGGCALNCVANVKIRQMVDNLWILPNPGDGGSSLGAASLVERARLMWDGPYLGVPIRGEYPAGEALTELVKTGVVAVANGRAEFGPRALGNRSIFADPRMPTNKTLVNQLKKREQFRPFAPVIMAEHVNEWFDINEESPYMQITVRCRKPDKIPAVVHVDGTSRIQTVTRGQHPGLYELLTKWKDMTGIPLLLNTSLNVKNEPLVNSEADAHRWAKENHGIKLFTRSAKGII